MAQSIKQKSTGSKNFTRTIEIGFIWLVSASDNLYYHAARQGLLSKETQAVQPIENIKPAGEVKPAAKIPHFLSSYNYIFI
jgi:hypothetical protein